MSNEIQPVEEQKNARLGEIKVGAVGAQLESMADYWTMAKAIVAAGIAPNGTDVAGVFISLQAGAEVGLPPIQSIKNIQPINNRPTIWGDAPMALCLRTGQMEWHRSGFEGEPFEDSYTAWFEAKRKGMPEVTRREFSVADAKAAKLWGKTGKNGQPTPWVTHPKRMLFVRARAFALRDAFPDALGGLWIGEEMPEDPQGANDGHASRSDAMLAALEESAPVDVEHQPVEPEEPEGQADGDLPPEPTPDEEEDIRQREMAEAGLFPEGGDDA